MFCLGRQPAKFDPSVPKLMSLSLSETVVPTILDDWKTIQYWPMLLNDQLGTCTIASVGHTIEYWNIIGKLTLPVMTDLEAEVFYQINGHYIPGDASTDNGCILLDVLNYFQGHGMMAASQNYKVNKFLSVERNDLTQIKSSVFHLGNCYLGLNFPSNALQTNLWTIDPNATAAGGHCVNVVGFDDTQNLLYVVSWGTIVPMTYDFFIKYCDEAWSLYSDDWVNR